MRVSMQVKRQLLRAAYRRHGFPAKLEPVAGLPTLTDDGAYTEYMGRVCFWYNIGKDTYMEAQGKE